MTKRAIIDSHIHLWPEETANQQGHAWMTPGMPLAKPHLLEDYYRASKQEAGTDLNFEIRGVVYIETDVRYDTPTADVSSWTRGPLDEIKFLRSIVEGSYGGLDSKMLLGFVPWAPMDQPPSVLKEYLRLAEEQAGPETWGRIKGFRFLLQSIRDPESFRSLVLSTYFVENLKELGRRGFSFDVGVDQRSGGLFQLDAIAKAMELAHRDIDDDHKVIFIINHLCKPEFADGGAGFRGWCDGIWTMSKEENTYMKLSGAFSELPSHLQEPKEIAAHMKPWISHAIKCFGAGRIMFGSDWPVCNVNGPSNEASWVDWTDVVALILDDESYGLTDEEKDGIWQQTVTNAYRLASVS